LAEVVEPVAAAFIKAVSPVLSPSCALAPFWQSNSMSVAAWIGDGMLAASISGVMPAWSAALTSAPFDSIIADVSLDQHAVCFCFCCYVAVVSS